MKRTYIVVLVLALLALGLAAHAQVLGTTARYLGMGLTGIAAADDAGAVDFNPANLGSLNLRPLDESYNVRPPQLDKPLWMAQGEVTSAVSGDLDFTAFHAAAYYINHVHKKHGFGVSFQTLEGGVLGQDGLDTEQYQPTESGVPSLETFTVGYGHVYHHENWGWGLSLSHKTAFQPRLVVAGAIRPSFINPEPGPAGRHTVNTLQGGLLWRLPQGQKAPIRLGLVVEDLLNDSGVGLQFHVGASVPVGQSLTLNADYLDVTDQVMNTVNVGAEYYVTPKWILRVGDANLFETGGSSSVFTAGAGWQTPRWNADLAWLSGLEGLGDELVVSSGYRF